MITSIQTVVTLSLGLAGLVRAQYDAALVGTWTTKSKKVVTGPGFYDPVADKLIEPDLAGISYSFTSDGYYEEAYYRAISNPTTPQCPSSIMQWQHGTYSLPGNGSIVLTPFGVDGRQLTSAPCSYDNAVYIRYEQPELFKSYQVLTDAFHNVPRLNLYQFDGSPMQPMYLMYSPPQMLPTQTLNPTSAPSATGKSRVKRTDGGDGDQEVLQPLNRDSHIIKQQPADFYNADRWWWAGVGLTALGTVMYMLPTSV
ncbi:uncharacterized protein PV07_00880 [Cladophialophora immunda]|uniref:Protein ROT1 n=1 Tax=Cladophialophora immunda TaxID=569365 RepID=A0A0D2CW63_9EURO|nr:uncharacterized protein PV07_00880 [Cladophialophora immunda]KIW34080.1 hypothetical protein PV07_00880 [Cladophialophora immunda]OQV03015.1 hypothetical protein CLAIMM_08116 [Cladophialophora immunda]